MSDHAGQSSTRLSRDNIRYLTSSLTKTTIKSTWNNETQLSGVSYPWKTNSLKRFQLSFFLENKR